MMKDKIIIATAVCVFALLSSCSDNIEETKTSFGLRGNVESLVEVTYKLDGENADVSGDNITKKIFVEFNRNTLITSHIEYIGYYNKKEYSYNKDGLCTHYIEYKDSNPKTRGGYFYDDLGNCIADSVGLYKDFSTNKRYKYYDFAGYIFGDSYEYNELGKKIKSGEMTYKYDKNNALIKTMGAFLIDSTLYVNNKYNDCVQETSYIGEYVFSSEEVSYEYDHNDNWTTKTSVILKRALTEPYDLSMEAEVVVRDITYYHN